MKTFASLALLAAGATAQVVESVSFGYGKTYVLKCFVYLSFDPIVSNSSFVLVSPPLETPFRDGTLLAKALTHHW